MPGTDPQSSSEDWLNKNWLKKKTGQKKQFWTLLEEENWKMLLTPKFWSVPLFVLTLVASQFHISEHTLDGCVSVTVLCLINWEEWDKVLPSETFLLSTVLFSEILFVWKSWNSQESHLLVSGLNNLISKLSCKFI